MTQSGYVICDHDLVVNVYAVAANANDAVAVCLILICNKLQ